ncbi:uracil-DNA glycosylase [Stigmatella aurantiaca]
MQRGLCKQLGGYVAFNVNDFVARVSKVQVSHHFNPYRDTCPEHDTPEAPQVRQANLRAYLQALQQFPIKAAWIGQDFGYLGGRRTGLPLTDEMRLSSFEKLYKTAPLKKATWTEAARESTALEAWKLLPTYSSHPPLLWNVVPLHPYEPGDSMSNVPFSRAAAQQCLPFLAELLNQFSPHVVIAVGRLAEDALTQLGVPTIYVRHPSHAGQRKFQEGIQKFMKF